MEKNGQSGGYVFSADILLAVIVFILLFGAMQYSLTEPGGGVETLQLRQIMDDTLSILDRDGSLQSFNETTIQNAVNGALPGQYAYKMHLEKWSISGSTQLLVDQKDFGDTTQDLSETPFVKGRRTFVKYAGSGIDSYYNLEYWAWVK